MSAILGKVFPPTRDMVRKGIQAYRTSHGLETRGFFPWQKRVVKPLIGQEFEAGGKTLKVMDVKTDELSGPTAPMGDVEGYALLMLPGIAAAVAAYPKLGSGDKKGADGAATQAMRSAAQKIYMKGTIRGGEGAGRDQMGRDAALYMGEPVGTGCGPMIDILVDPLEVTNQAKPLKRDAGELRGGEGWSAELVDPEKWYPGYSGALSLFLAVNASGPRGGIRSLTDGLYLNKLSIPWRGEAEGLRLDTDQEKVVAAVAKSFGIEPAEVSAAALARTRHFSTFESWKRAGMKDEKIHKPTDGDAMFAWAIGSGLIHFGGLTGGVMEGIIGATAGIPFGINTTFQFVSAAQLKEESSRADLQKEEHKFGFSGEEREEMLKTLLYDDQHIGSTVRALSAHDPLLDQILDAARAEADIEGFNFLDFMREWACITNSDQRARGDARFSAPSRALLNSVLQREGFLDVRRVYRLGDFRYNRDTMYFITALTPNKWAPLNGITAGNGSITTESLFVGGSGTVAVVTVKSVAV